MHQLSGIPSLTLSPSPTDLLSPSLTETADVSGHPNVVEVPLGCLHLARIALTHVLQGKDLLLAKRRIVVKVNLGVETNH